MKALFGTDYLTALIDHIRSAQRSIVMATMIFDTADGMKDVADELYSAQQRGVTVTLYIDTFTHIQFLTGRNAFREYNELHTAKARLHDLREAGATIIWLGKLGLNPFQRRFHQKVSIFDGSVVFFGGGINATGISFTFHDLMVRTENKSLATQLTITLARIAKEGYIADERYELDAHHTVLIDGGRPHSSIIYDTAIALAKKAKSTIFVSQMAPSGKLANILTQKPVTYYLNSPFAMSPISGASELLTQKRYRYKNNYKGHRYIHAKYMLFTMPGGEKILLTGSNNFNERGVRYGTKEIALMAKDDDLWNELYRYTTSVLTRGDVPPNGP